MRKLVKLGWEMEFGVAQARFARSEYSQVQNLMMDSRSFHPARGT